MTISVIITAYNEGDELLRTIESVRDAACGPTEIVVVDDASTDGSATQLNQSCLHNLVTQRNELRRGVAPCRNLGAAMASGGVFAFLDGHQRIAQGTIEACAQTAVRHQAIVWPDVIGFNKSRPVIHGARFVVDGKTFSARYKMFRPRSAVTPISALRAPGYLMPRTVYEKVKWASPLRGWGGSEAAVSLKAFFAGIPILHLCGPLARHKFKTSFHYEVTSEGVAWNHAVIARTCFDDRSWNEYWLPDVFASELPSTMIDELDSPAVREEQRDFQELKVRSDRDFWSSLVKTPQPPSLRRTTVGSRTSKNRKIVSQ